METEKKKKRVWRQFCDWLSVAVACLPAAVSLLLLEALFMQFSGVSLALPWPCRLCLLRVPLCVSHCYKLSSFQAHWGRWHCTHFLRLACLFTAHVGSGSSPLSCGVFFPPLLLQAFPLLIAGCVLLLLPTLAQLVYLQFCEGFPLPHSLVLRVPHPLCCVSFLLLLLITQFLFFSLGGGRSVQGAMLIWPRVVCGSTAYRLAHLVRVFPSCLGTGIWWQRGGPPGFSV
jgi:hypothetical protein